MLPSKIDAEAIEHKDYEKTGPHLRRDSSNSSKTHHHDENGLAARRSTRQPSVAALLRNPLAGTTEQEVSQDVNRFVDTQGFQDYRDAFRTLLGNTNSKDDGFTKATSVAQRDRYASRLLATRVCYDVSERGSDDG